nr:immunoglobulin heavy chain junction region [Mus musculus]
CARNSLTYAMDYW